MGVRWWTWTSKPIGDEDGASGRKLIIYKDNSGNNIQTLMAIKREVKFSVISLMVRDKNLGLINLIGNIIPSPWVLEMIW